MAGLDTVAAAQLADTPSAQGMSMPELWRHVIVQLFDDYTSDLKHHGVSQAQLRFSTEPPRTTSPRIDAALAALAEYVARRDGWPTPPWARSLDRYTRTWWWVSPLPGMHATALQESPLSFSKRGIFITKGALSRV